MPLNTCPNCGSHDPGSSPIMNCLDPWHMAGPELMFSFRLPGPEYSKTVSETELKGAIERTRNRRNSHMDELLLVLATERMIEMAKVSVPKPKLSPKSPESIRRQIAQMLEDVGLNPDRFLTKPDNPHGGPSAVYSTKEPNNVCFKTDEATKAEAERGATLLAKMLYDDLGVSVTPIILRLWLVERWSDVAKLAHKIHGGA